MKEDFIKYIQYVVKTLETDYDNQEETKEALTDLLIFSREKAIKLSGDRFILSKNISHALCFPQGEKYKRQVRP